MPSTDKPAVITWIEPDELHDPHLRSGFAYWLRMRGARRWPTREDVNPRALSGLVEYMALIKVIDGGTDFELRLAGDAVVRAFNVPVQRRHFTDIAGDAPHLIAHSFPIFRRVVASGAPLAWRQCDGLNASPDHFTDSEVVLMPLGAAEVDHVLGFAVHYAKPPHILTPA